MVTLNKRNIFEDVIIEHGYSGWHVIKSSRLNPEDNPLVFNPKEKKINEIAIPEEWLHDPSRRSTVGEILASAIQNVQYILPAADLKSSRLSGS